MSVSKATLNPAKLESILCPVCHSISSLWAKVPKASLYRCQNCNHCFTDISSISHQESYGSDYYLETHKNWFENPNFPLFDLLKSEILQHQSKSVLDVGCGNGAFLRYLATTSEKIELKGIDLSDAAAETLNIQFIQSNFLTYDFNRKFDAIVSLAVIEHLDNVTAFINRIHELLNKDGVAYIMTLNESGILYRFANLLRILGVSSVFIRLYDPHHVNHFSKSSLKKLLTKDKLFKVQKVIDHNTPLNAIDVPSNNIVLRFAMKVGVALIFMMGKITKKAYLQTIVVSKVG